MTLTKNFIIQRARALLAQLAPITGARATGSVIATAAGGDVVVPRNSYLIPIRNGAVLPQQLYKVAPNPDTLVRDGTGGSWVVTSDGTPIDIVSNVGGARHNLAEGEALQWDPPIAGLEPTVTVATGGITGGTNTGAVQAVSFYEELGPDTKGLFEGSIGHFPAVMVVWDGSSMAEGKSLGLRQGGSRKGRKVAVWFERYVMFVVASKSQSDAMRRRDGLDIVEDASALISDRQVNDDREALTVVGVGVEISERRRIVKSQHAYIYQLTLKLSRTQQPIDSREFNPWLRSRQDTALPADPPDLEEKTTLDHEWEQDHPLNDP